MNLTDSLARDLAPAWSPDGARIAFISDIDYVGDFPPTDVYVMQADGTGRARRRTVAARETSSGPRTARS